MLHAKSPGALFEKGNVFDESLDKESSRCDASDCQRLQTELGCFVRIHMANNPQSESHIDRRA
jgi:hypothetical protein